MAETTVPITRAEIAQALADQKPIHEGLRDFSRLNIKDPTATIVTQTITAYDTRQMRMENALNALDALLADGYPEVPVQEIGGEEYADLAEQVSTVTAALTTFSAAEPAAALSLSAAPAEHK